ncbi:hypothetical protein D3C71_1840120 [compost metagenome]
MRFVADDEVEVGQAVALLRAADNVDGVVGAEDHAHVRGVVPFGHLGGQAAWFGRGGVAQLVSEGLNAIVVLLALLADFAVGADREAVQRRDALLRPLGQGL